MTRYELRTEDNGMVLGQYDLDHLERKRGEPKDVTTLGSAEECTIRIPDRLSLRERISRAERRGETDRYRGVSRMHAMISKLDTVNGVTIYTIQDLNSTNGTYLNGDPLDQMRHTLRPGDRIGLGDPKRGLVEFVFDEMRQLPPPKEIKIPPAPAWL